MDNHRAQPGQKLRTRVDTLRIGYVPLVHAAPLLVAEELGLFARQGLAVRLSREVGWATVREKILSGELDAAQALAPMPLALTLGLNSARCDCTTALVLNLHGNVVVLARQLWLATEGDPGRLRQQREASGSPEPLTFGIVYPHSTHAFVLREWLHQAGLVPDRDYRLAVVPPQQMVAHLKAGHLAGCCVGEPWGSLAVRDGVGVIAAFSADLAPNHAEKVLLVRRAFAEQRAAEHTALITALREACAWCANAAHHEQVASLLSGNLGLGHRAECLRPAITGHFDLGAGRTAYRPDAVVFDGPGVHTPSPARAEWLARLLGVTPAPELLADVYRGDPHEPARPNPLPAAVPSPASLPTSRHECVTLP